MPRRHATSGPCCRRRASRRRPPAERGAAGLRAPRSPAAASGAPGSRPAPSPGGQAAAPARPRGGRAPGCRASCGRGNRSSRPVPCVSHSPSAPAPAARGSRPRQFHIPFLPPPRARRSGAQGQAPPGASCLPGGARRDRRQLAPRPPSPQVPRAARTIASGQPRAGPGSRGRCPSAQARPPPPSPVPAAGRAGWQRAAAPRPPALRGAGGLSPCPPSGPGPGLWGRAAPEATGPLGESGHRSRQSMMQPNPQSHKNQRLCQRGHLLLLRSSYPLPSRQGVTSVLQRMVVEAKLFREDRSSLSSFSVVLKCFICRFKEQSSRSKSSGNTILSIS